MFIVRGPGNGQWSFFPLAVGSTSYQHFCLVDVSRNKERDLPYADEALGSEDVSEAVTDQWAPRGFTYQVKSVFIGIKPPGR